MSSFGHQAVRALVLGPHLLLGRHPRDAVVEIGEAHQRGHRARSRPVAERPDGQAEAGQPGLDASCRSGRVDAGITETPVVGRGVGRLGQRLAPVGRAVGDLEPLGEVEVHRLVRVGAIDVQCGGRHPEIPERDEAARDQGLGEAAPTPAGAGPDGLQDAAIPAVVGIRHRVDPVPDAAGDLIAVEGDDPRGHVREVALEGRPVRLGPLLLVAVVPERIARRLPDRPSVRLGHGPDDEALGQRAVGDVVHRGPDHVVAAGDGMPAAALEQDPRAVVAIARVGEHLPGSIGREGGRDLAEPDLGPGSAAIGRCPGAVRPGPGSRTRRTGGTRWSGPATPRGGSRSSGHRAPR